MKKLLLIISFVLAALPSYAEKVFRVATDIWEPYEYVVDNKNVGLSTEIVEGVFNRMNLYISNPVPNYPWARVEDMLNKNEIDAMYTATYDPKRAAIHKYPSEPIVDSDWVLLINKQYQFTTHYTNLGDLKGKIIGTVNGFAYPEHFLKYIKENSKIEQTNRDELNIKKLALDRVDYVIMDKYNALYLIKNLNLSDKIMILPKVVEPNRLYLVFNKKVPVDVVKLFDEELIKFKATKEYKEILDKYLK